MTDVHVKSTMSYVWTKLIILDTPTSITYNVLSLCIYVFPLIRNGHLEIVQFLVNGNHCRANAGDRYGRTALHYAAQ